MILVAFLIVLEIEILKPWDNEKWKSGEDEQTELDAAKRKRNEDTFQKPHQAKREFTPEEIEQQRKIHEKYGFGFVGPENISLPMLEKVLENERNWLNEKRRTGYQQMISNAGFEWMDGTDFEEYCADILSLNGYDCEVTRKSGDYGADIIAKKNGTSYAVQCKCYSGSVGLSAVQEANGGRDYYGTSRAVVLTNSSFTKQAINGAERMNVLLWSGEQLGKLIASASENL